MSTNLLKPADVGLRLGLSRASIYRLISAGEFNTVPVGARGATRIEESEVAAYIDRKRTERRTA
jgi:predicted DNA-binding transcriptional regulator AlpA